MRRTKSAALVVAAVLFSFLLTAGAASAQEQPAAVIEAMSDATWQPADVTVGVGDTVEWQFDQGGTVHDVQSTSDNWSLNSGFKSPSDPPVDFTFTEPGTYTFVCSVHPGTMTGSVTVEEAPAPDELENVLVFSKTAGFRHSSIPDGIAAIEQLGADNDFNVDATEDSTQFNDANLAQYDAVVFLSTTGDVLDDEQQAAFERYVQAGNGYVGIHAAADTEYTWSWYGEMLGGYFRNHPPGTPDATVNIEDGDEPSTEGLPTVWERTDEWYNYQSPVTPNVGGGGDDYSPRDSGVHVLATVDESTYDEQDGNATDDDHPISWCSDFDGGHVWYTGMGHTEASFGEPEFLQHILGGLETVTGAAPADCGEPREPVGPPPTGADFEIVTIDDDTESPMELDIAADGRVFYIERITGEINVYDPATGAVTTAIQIPVDSALENGGIGLTLSPDFEETGHIYVAYTPPKSISDDEQFLSRFTVGPGNTIDPASEQRIFSWQLQRETCCHSAGSLAFDEAGNLYISTGDNVNPFESDGSAPIDERPGRENFDAQRTSANSNDLNGKILRITPVPGYTGVPGLGDSYTIPEGNMFDEAADTEELTRPEIYAMGFRNPFRMTIDPKTGWVLLGNYGPDAGSTTARGPQGSVEFEVIKGPGFYGWPYCVRDNVPYADYDFATGEIGPKFDCQNPVNDSPNNTGLTELPPAIPAAAWLGYSETDPRHPNLGTGGAPTGGPRYDFDPNLESDTKFPAFYDGHWFIGEWNNGWIKTATLDAAGNITSVNDTPWMDTFFRPHEIEFGPEGSLYVIDWGSGFGGNNVNSGIYRIDYVAGNRRPIATGTATPDNGDAPLEVQFSSEGSVDPEGTELTYEWDFGDGETSTEPNPTHTFEEPGTYDVLLTVTDGDGDTGTDTIRVVAGNNRPTVEIVLPEDGKFADFGDTVPYEIQVSDPEDGTIDCDRVVLSIQLGHDEHAHGLGEQTGCEGTIQTETDGGHGAQANIFTSLVATYTDNGGAGGASELTGRDEVILHTRRKQAEYFTETGRAPGGAAGGTPGVQTEGTSDEGGGDNVGFIEHGDYIAFERMNLEELSRVRFRVASAGQGGTIQLRLDAPDGELVGETEFIEPTGGWQSWTSVDLALDPPPEGTHTLYIVFNNPDAGDASLMNLNWFQVFGKGASITAPPEVSASAEPENGEAPLTVQFTGVATDPDAMAGEEMTYEWDFGVAGTTDDTSTELSPTYTYERAGTYTATFTATDPHGAHSTATVEVRVTSPPGECPQNNVRSDEFEGSSLDTNRWTIIRPDDTRPPTVSDGQLHFPIDNGSIYLDGTSARNIVVQPLPDGEVSVTAKITVDELTENYQQAGLRVYQDDDNWASVHMIYAGGSRDFEFIYENAGNPRNGAADKLGGIPADAPLTYWVRINSDGSELTAEYSFDGETFEPVGQPADISGWADPQIGPVALSDQASTYPVAHYDWIRFDPDSSPGGGGGFVDEFDGSELGEGWEVVRRNQELTVSGGTLNIPAAPGDLYGGRNDAANLVLRDAPDGPWVATAKVNFEGTEQYHQAGMLVYGDDSNFTKLGRLITNPAGSAHAEKFEFIYENAGTPRNEAADSTANLPADFPADYWVRITSDGTNITGAYSTDGSSWTPVGRPAPLPANARIGLFAFSNNGTGNPVAAFDSFSLTGENVGGGPSGPSFDDEFDGSSLDKDRWNAIVREDETGYEVAGGQLTITLGAGDIYTTPNSDPPNLILQDAAHAGADWTIETKIDASLSDGYGQGGLMAYVDDANYVKWDAISDAGTQEINRLELRSEVGEVIQANPADPQVPPGTTEIWLRLTKTGDEYLGEYSFDGETWTATEAPVTNPMDSPDFGIFAFAPQETAVGDTVAFDYFLLNGRDAGGEPCACVPGAGDDFEGSSLDKSRWSVVREDESLYEVSGGALRVTTVGGDIYAGGDPAPTRNFFLQQPTSGDWVIETKVSGDLSGGYEQGGLIVYQDDANYIKYDLISDQDQTVKNRIELRSEEGDAVQDPQPQVTNLDVDAAWLRLTKSGDMYTGEYSLDGETWEPIGEPVQNDMAAPMFGLFTLGVNSPGGTAVFDYFSVNGSTGCAPQEPENAPPVIDSATATPASGFGPLDVQFDVTATDADEDELTYSWDFDGDGTEDSTEEDPSHTYTEPGQYEAEVTVSDGTAERSSTVEVNVLEDDDADARFRVLVFSKTEGFRHGSIEEGHAAIEQLGAENDFQVDHTEDSTLFRDEVLEHYDSVVWLSTTGDVLNDEQQAAFERYIQAGGGYTGIHSAADTEYGWKWYGSLVGAYFLSHPAQQDATVAVEDADDHSTAGLPARWDRFDEWYNYKPVNFEETGNVDYSPRGDVHVLASLDETTYDEGDGSDEADDHPISWCQRYDGGRSWYTGMGHTDESFSEELYLQHILGGIEVSAGVAESEECGADTTEPGSPTVEGFANPDSGAAPLRVRFSATGLDPDGGRLTYMWDFGDGGRSYATSPVHTYRTPGEYTATVTATDEQGQIGTDTVQITVTENAPPTVTATAEQPSVVVPAPVRFHATADDPNGNPGQLVYAWDFGDGEAAFGKNAVHRYREPGEYTATVTVTDPGGMSASATVDVTVTNTAPTVAAAADPAAGSAPLRVLLSSQGHDADGHRFSYSWDPGDGSAPVERRNLVHTYVEPGTYTATVTVTDRYGATGTAEVDVTVTEAPNGAPTVRAAADPASGDAPLRVRFTAAGSDPDGDPLSYVWDYGDGVKAGGPRVVHTYREAGTYTATVTVTDRHGNSGAAQVTVEVGEPGARRGVRGESAERIARVKAANREKVGRVAKRGLRFRVACETDCKANGRLRLTKRFASKLGLGDGARALGKARAKRIEGGDSRKLRLRLDRSLRRHLRKAMRNADMKWLRTRLIVNVRSEAGRDRLRQRVNLKR